MGKTREDESGPIYTLEQLRAIVSAGMAVTEARALLEDGYSADDVLSLAQLQSEQRTKAATETQQATAKAMQKAMRPENEFHPGKSAFSYPEGDVARPKVVPPFEFWYNGYPCSKFLETEHWRECELMAQVSPGEYTVIRKDGSKMAVSVTGERDADGKLTRVNVVFPVSREEKWLVPAKSVVLYQIAYAGMGKTPKQLYLEAMNEYLAQMFGAEAVEA